MIKIVRERRGREECCHVITVRPNTDMKWSVPWTEKKEMWIKKRKHSPSFSFFSLIVSFVLSLLFSLSFQCWRSPHSPTQTLPPLHVITASKDRREKEAYTTLKRMLILKKRRENVPNSLSLISPPSSFSLSSSHSLSLFFSCQHTVPSYTFGYTPFWRRDVNVSTSFLIAAVKRAFSSSVFATLTFEAIAREVILIVNIWGKIFTIKITYKLKILMRDDEEKVNDKKRYSKILLWLDFCSTSQP